MFIREEYNRQRTLSLLEALFQTISSQQDVTPQMIYNTLGEESVFNEEYLKISCWDNLYQLIQNVDLIPQNMSDEEYNSYMEANIKTKAEIIKKFYQAGDYFHISLNDEIKSNERLIINMSTQCDATDFVLKLTSEKYNKVAQKITLLKFYAEEVSTQKTLLKYDKIVMYYDHNDFDIIQTALEELLPGITQPHLNAFYHLYKKDDKAIYFGVAEEKNPDVSFSELRTKDILNFITGPSAVPQYWNTPIDCRTTRSIIRTRGIKEVVQDCFNSVINDMKLNN